MPTHLEILEHQESIRKNIGDCYYPRDIVINDEIEKGGPGSGRRRGGGMRTRNVGRRSFQTGIDRDRAIQSSAKAAAKKTTKGAAEKAKQDAKDEYEYYKKKGNEKGMENAQQSIKFHSLVAKYAKPGKFDKGEESPVLVEIENALNILGVDIEKGRAVPVGTIRERGGRKYIKTASGWEYYKGTSSDRGAKKNIEGHQNIETRKKIQRLESQIKDYQQSVQGAGHFASQIKELKAKIKSLKSS